MSATPAVRAPRAHLTYVHDSVDYYPHQVDGIRKMAKMSSFLLADEMGLGKSLQAMTVFAIEVERNPDARAIVVAPATLKGNWEEEFEKFTTFRVMVLDGSKTKRDKQLRTFLESQSTDEPYHVLIVNYEQLADKYKSEPVLDDDGNPVLDKKGKPKKKKVLASKGHLDDVNAIGFTVAIYDEAHLMKNPDAERTVAAHGVQARRSFLLTGSPMLNHVHELWSILFRINPDAFPNYYAFLHRYVVFGGFKGKQPVGVKNEAELRRKLSSIMIRRTKGEVLDLPDKMFIPVKVDMLPEQRKVYREVRDEMRLTLPDDPTPVEIENALHRFTILKQAAATLACFEGMKDVSAKLDEAVTRWLELYDSGYKVVFFTQFRPVLAALEARLVAATTPKGIRTIKPYSLHGDVAMNQRQPTVSAWRDSKYPDPLLCMSQVAGVGLNMTASRHMFRLDKLFVPKLNEQIEDRLHRIGADLTQPVTIFDFIARGTIEQRVEAILRQKSALFGAVVDDADFKRKLVKMLMEEDDDDL